jgi:hypothetical protein
MSPKNTSGGSGRRMMRELPLGDQGFAEIIDRDLLYADKTRYIYELLASPKRNYFLSRPRRFGKTLLIRTLKELFTGERRRFKGLWIDRSDYDFPRLPVVYLSLSMKSTANIEAVLINKLRRITDAHDLRITATPESSEYITDLVMALHNKYDSKVAVLIDEYDAPVTRNMDKPELARANADVLHAFFAELKNDDVSERVAFTLVTGITRYALTSMDSGPNHLNDLSLDPRYAGICGFTVDEFEPLFADRLEGTLASLKDSGGMPPSATLDDLRASILDWYDGYKWGGETRILNPYSMLNFFDQAAFGPYWPDSGRPGHLAALIKDRPLDFLEPKLESYLAADVKKTELANLQAVPVLFHSGYLTVDKIIPALGPSPAVDGAGDHKRLTFRLPNREVASSYHADCLQVILDLGSAEELKEKGVIFRKALLNRDGETIESELKNIFSAISFHQRPHNEAGFHAIVQTFLMGLNFKVLTEVPGFKGRLDLLVELSDREYVIIELRHLKGEDRLKEAAEDKLLEPLAIERLSNEALDQALMEAFLKKLPPDEKERLFSEKGVKDSPIRERYLDLAKRARKRFSASEIARVLANKARKELPDEAEKISREAARNFGLTDERIATKLTRAAQGALRDIVTRGYHGVIGHMAKSITDLGLAIFGYGDHVRVVFGPVPARTPSAPKNSLRTQKAPKKRTPGSSS